MNLLIDLSEKLGVALLSGTIIKIVTSAITKKKNIFYKDSV